MMQRKTGKYESPFLAEVKSGVITAFSKINQGAVDEDLGRQISGLIVQPPEFRLGQAALPCHQFAKKLRLPPVKIAEALKQELSAQSLKWIGQIDSVNGYLNFHCRSEVLGEWLLNEIAGGGYFAKSLLAESEQEKMIVEYSQPNTHKALHVGHLRNTVFGDAVCKVLHYAGHEIVRATYPGDMGAHIAKALWYVQTKKGGKLPPATENRADWLGVMYAESEACLRTAEKDDVDEFARIKIEIGKVLKELHSGKGPYYDLYLETREWSLGQMRDVYAWLGVAFDIWYFESECDVPSKELVLNKFKEGFFSKSEGAVGIDLSQYGLGFAMYLKSDGNGLYLTKDLELIRRKFEDPKITRSIYVVDARQKLHFQQLFKTAELMGYPQAAKSVHLSYESVTDESGEPCSSRTLKGVRLSVLRDLLEGKVKKDYLERYRGEWTDEQINATAEAVALGALKYGFLRVDGQTVIRFVLDEWLKLDGDTGPYLQYVHARCCSVIEKVGRPKDLGHLTLETEIEKELLYYLGRFNHYAAQAAREYR
ncbi:MAG TPA: arginine--tRNA ligase, partial [Oligoflexia bacterium]|nr:arginine--tRNA ligase [Oligoflexia bacterium]